MGFRLSLLLLSLLAIVVFTASSSQTLIPECSNSEINSLMNNEKVRNCAIGYRKQLPSKGCTSLRDQSCYCQSPDFMASMSRCLFENESSLQVDLIRCGKWYGCPSLSPKLNITNTQLTQESKSLLDQASKLAAITNDGSKRLVLKTEAYIFLALLILLGWMVFW